MPEMSFQQTKFTNVFVRVGGLEGGGVVVGALNIFLSIFELQGLKSPSRVYMKGVKR